MSVVFEYRICRGQRQTVCGRADVRGLAAGKRRRNKHVIFVSLVFFYVEHKVLCKTRHSELTFLDIAGSMHWWRRVNKQFYKQSAVNAFLPLRKMLQLPKEDVNEPRKIPFTFIVCNGEKVQHRIIRCKAGSGSGKYGYSQQCEIVLLLIT